MSLKKLVSNQTRKSYHSSTKLPQDRNTSFNHTVTSDGNKKFLTANRYHLYMSYACPFAHRASLLRSLKGLDNFISMSALWVDNDSKFIFSDNPDEGSSDKFNNKKSLMAVYKMSDSKYKGNATVPALFDINSNKIVNNDSGEIMRMFNTLFNECAEYPDRDFYPSKLRKSIDSVNEWVDRDLNIGVYLVGAANKQIIYDKQVRRVFSALDKAEEILSKQRYICGDKLTEADLRLFSTLIRFDSVYYALFHCNMKLLREYTHLSGYMRELYQTPGVENTVNMEHIKSIYMKFRRDNNPKRIIPIGPSVDLLSPPDRDHLTGNMFSI